MTTSHTGQPPDHTQQQRQDTSAVLATALLVAVFAGGSIAAWSLGGGGGGGASLAGRPRVTDSIAGLSYAIPPGWRQSDEEELAEIGMFSSLIWKNLGGYVVAGRLDGSPESELKQRADEARDNAKLIFEPAGETSLVESRAVTVSGRPAHTAAFTVRGGHGESGYLRTIVIAVTQNSSVYLSGSTPDAAGNAAEIEAILASAQLM